MREIEDSFYYYKLFSPTLSEQFKTEIQEKFELLLSNPLMYQSVTEDIRKVVLDKFPYSIFYSFDEFQIKILALAHFKRKPKYWKSRK
jgi:plasmid stabilization system protein ParE